MSNEEMNPLLARATEMAETVVSSGNSGTTSIQELTTEIYNSLVDLQNGEVEDVPGEPAVPIRKSITPDHLICLEDGKQLKMLKRYLRTHYDMSPDEYRARWNLPADYPMVAPNYSKTRSSLAKSAGLGKTPPKAKTKRATKSRKRAA